MTSNPSDALKNFRVSMGNSPVIGPQDPGPNAFATGANSYPPPDTLLGSGLTGRQRSPSQSRVGVKGSSSDDDDDKLIKLMGEVHHMTADDNAVSGADVSTTSTSKIPNASFTVQDADTTTSPPLSFSVTAGHVPQSQMPGTSPLVANLPMGTPKLGAQEPGSLQGTPVLGPQTYLPPATPPPTFAQAVATMGPGGRSPSMDAQLPPPPPPPPPPLSKDTSSGSEALVVRNAHGVFLLHPTGKAPQTPGSGPAAPASTPTLSGVSRPPPHYGGGSDSAPPSPLPTYSLPPPDCPPPLGPPSSSSAMPPVAGPVPPTFLGAAISSLPNNRSSPHRSPNRPSKETSLDRSGDRPPPPYAPPPLPPDAAL